MTEDGADLTFPTGVDPLGVGAVADIGPANGGAPFGATDSFTVFGQMAGGQDSFRFTFTAPFEVTLNFLSDDAPTNTPVWRLYAGTTNSGTPLGESTVTAASRAAPVSLFSELGPIAAGTYVLQIDGSGSATAREAYDVTVASVVPLPAGAVLLLSALGGMAALRRLRSTKPAH